MNNPALFVGIDSYGPDEERIPPTYYTDISLRDLFAAVSFHAQMIAIATRGDALCESGYEYPLASEETLAAAAYRNADQLLLARGIQL